MTWLPIESAPRDGSPIAYVWHAGIVSTCVWLAEADKPGWWDVRAAEPASPRVWAPIEVPGVHHTARTSQVERRVTQAV